MEKERDRTHMKRIMGVNDWKVMKSVMAGGASCDVLRCVR